MTKQELPSPRIMISSRDLKDIIRDELFALQAKLSSDLSNELVKEVAKTVVHRALRSPK